ncbi:MAG: hypothetical protein ACYC1A_02490 [Spirochaetales bacterium]
MRRSIISRAAKAFAVLALLFALTASLSAQDLAAWFAKPANQAAYGAIAAEAQTLAAAVRAASLSDSLLAARLEEAARKRVPAPVLLATLKQDTARYLSVSKALSSRGLLPSDAKKASAMIEQVALLLRGGIAESELSAALDAAVTKLGATAANNATVTRAVAALSVVANAKAQYGFSEENCHLLAIALTESDLSNKKLDSVLDSIATLVAQGGSVSDALNSVIAKISKGNSAEAKAVERSNEGKSGEKENQGNSGEKENNGKSGENGNGRKQ